MHGVPCIRSVLPVAASTARICVYWILDPSPHDLPLHTIFAPGTRQRGHLNVAANLADTPAAAAAACVQLGTCCAVMSAAPAPAPAATSTAPAAAAGPDCGCSSCSSCCETTTRSGTTVCTMSCAARICAIVAGEARTTMPCTPPAAACGTADAALAAPAAAAAAPPAAVPLLPVLRDSVLTTSKPSGVVPAAEAAAAAVSAPLCTLAASFCEATAAAPALCLNKTMNWPSIFAPASAMAQQSFSQHLSPAHEIGRSQVVEGLVRHDQGQLQEKPRCSGSRTWASYHVCWPARPLLADSRGSGELHQVRRRCLHTPQKQAIKHQPLPQNISCCCC